MSEIMNNQTLEQEQPVQPKKKYERDLKDRVNDVVKHAIGVVLLLYSLTLLIPIAWMLINSFKTYVEYYQTTAFEFPQALRFDNYSFILKNFHYTVNSRDGTGKITYTLPWMFLYSAIWAIAPTLFRTLVTTMCAYVIAKYKFPGRDFIYNFGIVMMILPIIGSGGAGMILKRSLGVYNNMFMMIITNASGAFAGMHFMMLHAAFKGIPWEYAEAVFIDGGGHLRVFTTIMMPMIMPTVWVIVLLGVISGWNDYSTFLMWLPSYANIAIGIYKFQYNRIEMGTTMPQILASFVLVSMPIVILYVSVQKIITSNYMIGGLKG